MYLFLAATVDVPLLATFCGQFVCTHRKLWVAAAVADSVTTHVVSVVQLTTNQDVASLNIPHNTFENFII